MSMKKQVIAVLLFLCGMTVRAEDEFLFWMIDQSAKIEGKWGITTEIKDGTYYAKVGYAETGITVEQIVAGGTLTGYLNLYENAGDQNALRDSSKYGGSNARTGIDGYPGVLPVYAGMTKTDYTYWVELWNEQSGIVGYASLGTYESLSEYISPMKDLPTVPISISTFTVPEPNSALLLMIGCAALALRRRRKIAA